MMTYELGRRSLSRLEGIHPDMILVVKVAIIYTEVDFTITEGMRLKARQRKLVDSGASWTMDSRHLTGHAIDLAPWIDRRISWDWPPFFKIARAMQMAGRDLGIKVRWGGAWDRQLTATATDPHDQMNMYVAKRHAQGRNATPDGPHFELPRVDPYR